MTVSHRLLRFRQACAQLRSLRDRRRPISPDILDALEERAQSSLARLPASAEVFRALCRSWSPRLFETFAKAHGAELQSHCARLGDTEPDIVDDLLLRGPGALVTAALNAGLKPSDTASLVRRLLKEDDAEALRACGAMIAQDGDNDMLALLIHHCQSNCAPIVLRWMRHAAGDQKHVLVRSVSRRLQAPHRSGNLKFLAAHVAIGLDLSAVHAQGLPPEIRHLLDRTRSKHQLLALPGFDPIAILGTDHREPFFGLREIFPGFHIVKAAA